MSLWILDTGHVSLFRKRHPVVTQRINAVNTENIAITIITVEEQLRGRFNVIRKASSSDALLLAYAKLQATLEFFKNVRSQGFNEYAINCYEDLIRQRIRIGTQDLRIAVITLSVNGIFVTRNRKDFEKDPNLRL
ncbi:type II toxin-antitoxin system VapC family toxin [Nostoc sp. 'Lobaria pulmonaria (5183) cyanobiont']|uniref:type II toxin-antitoxin system VapC family toxin n=1 Tax=Nostoc sp. 'Lobaria pulmonaria (5183) cyanobiont' TaxID=1618022 RepID=UPI000CF3522F|nr:type II toxin-antitoxin system VapC family toxin [Nostoc sp. 'Lobaria pulmonaria (5183) cyanobiont']AVH72495.1 PIN domain protein [Nostoc sp. 'Lobaria pulmonaria (5183) cyanobiont']